MMTSRNDFVTYPNPLWVLLTIAGVAGILYIGNDYLGHGTNDFSAFFHHIISYFK